MSVATFHRALRSKVGIIAMLAFAVAALIALATINPDRGSNSEPSTAIAEPAPTGSGAEPGAMGADDAAKMDAGVAAGPADMDGREIASTEAAVVASPTSSLPTVDARIMRSGAIQLRVPRGGFERVWGAVHDVADSTGARVQSASRSGTGKAARIGVITLTVPSAKFDAAVDQLRVIGKVKVTRLDVTSEDVTEEYVDVKSRLRHDRAVEARLLGLLAQTKGVGEVLAVQTRLDAVQEQIEVETGRLNYLTQRTATSTIEVSLREPAKGGAEAKEDDDPSVIGNAFGDARDRFSENVASAIAWTGGALPTLLLLALIAVAGRIVHRRSTKRRAGAHDTPTV